MGTRLGIRAMAVFAVAGSTLVAPSGASAASAIVVHPGQSIQAAIDGALVRGRTVDGFEGSGVLLFCADRWRVTGVSAHDNGEYGIFPSHSGPGRVDHSLATGSNDTGIYVGQSHDVRVDHNNSFTN